MTHGSLFSGIGGFDLAAEWMGWENKFHCEWNEFGQKVLKYYWPNAESFTDITKSDFTKYANQIDVLSGGFPCQPYSTAGKRLGKEDERHLWPEMCRAIREIKPHWVVGENVYGLVSWNGGLVFHEIQSDLEAEGYEVFPYLLPAASVGAPHIRQRIWFVAHNPSNPHSVRLEQCQDGTKVGTRQAEMGKKGGKPTNAIKTNGKVQDIADTPKLFKKPTDWENFPTVAPICDGDDGLSSRLDGITFSKWRIESIKAGGNAIVPNVALQLFKTIKQYETTI